MISTGRGRAGARIPMIMSLTMAATLVVGAPAFAQDDANPPGEAFQAAVTEARDAAQAQIDEAWQAVEDGCGDIATEACLQGFLALQLPIVAQGGSAFADQLENLDAPDAYADDVAAMVAAERDIADLLQEASTAAAVGDDPRTTEGLDAVSGILGDLATRLSPEYARFAFLSSFRDVDFVGVFGGSTPEESAYLIGLRNVGQAGASNFSCFGNALERSYGGTDALLAALYDCGAGTTLAAIEARGRLLTPPESLADEHAWWLAAAAEGSRLDGLIGEAAREGDAAKFLANNGRLSMTHRPYPGMDRAVLAALGFDVADDRLDLTSELGRSDYGRALFAALVEYEAVNPTRVGRDALDFPQLPEEVSLQAVAELAPDLLALEADLREALENLDPPEAFAADHAMMMEFFDSQRDRIEAFIEAAAMGDLDAIDTLHDSEHAQNCAVANELSAAIRPVTTFFFDTESPDCS